MKTDSLTSHVKNAIKNLFTSEDLTVVNFSDMVKVPIDEWQVINNGKVRFRFIEKESNYLIAETEWLEISDFNLHLHEDCDETITVIKKSLTYKSMIRNAFGRMYFKAGTPHKVKGEKGTLIYVKFDLID